MLLAVLSSGCRGQGDAPVVLYLREPQPVSNSFQRVNLGSRDLGTLGLQPPVGGEVRSCGSVVAFASSWDPPSEGLYLDEVLYRVWWTSGNRRGSFALSAPGLDRAIAQLPVAATPNVHPSPPREQGYVLTTARVPVGRQLSQEQLAGLMLSVDVAGASVAVVTCPRRASLLVLNPPSPQRMAALDSDGDGMSDADEWADFRRDPYRVEGPARDGGCLPPNEALRPPTLPPAPALPPVDRVLESLHDVDTLRFSHETVLVRGDLCVHGSLVLHDASLLLAPDAHVDRAPQVVIASGASLVVEAGSLVMSTDLACGYHLLVEQGASLSLSDSRFVHGGCITLDADVRLRPGSSALSVWADDARIQGCSFINNLVALELGGRGAELRDNDFQGNATAVLVLGGGGSVTANRSVADGVFVYVDAPSGGWELRDNEARWTLDVAFRLQSRSSHNRIIGNHVLAASAAVDIGAGARDNRISDNRFLTCKSVVQAQEEVLGANVLEDNLSTRSEDPACRGYMDLTGPPDPPGGSPAR